MKFSTREDIEAPIEAVFDMLSEFDTFERAAMRRGAEVQCLSPATPPKTGMTWKAAFDLRGKRRDLTIELITFDRPDEIVLESTSQGILAVFSLELMALSRTQTRVQVSLEATAKNLSARLLLQSLKLAKTSLNAKYKERVAEYAKTLEERYDRMA